MAIESEFHSNQTLGNEKENFDKHSSSSFSDWWRSSGFTDIDKLIFFPQSEIVSMENAPEKGSECTVFPDDEPMDASEVGSDQKSTVSCLSLGSIEMRHIVGGRRCFMIKESQDDNFLKCRSAEDQKMPASLIESRIVDPVDKYNAYATSSVLVFGNCEPVSIAFVRSENTPDAHEEESKQENGGCGWKSTFKGLRCLFCCCC